jgi:hypothetical protein
MSNHLAIATVTSALKGIVERGMAHAGLGATATLRRPFPAATDPGPEATIFLYSLAPNGALRNGDLPFRSGDGHLVGRPQAALTLDYLISFYGDESRLEPQRLLGGTVASLHAEAEVARGTIRAIAASAAANTTGPDGYLAATDLDRQPELVRFSPLPLDMEELSRLWSTFVQVPYVLSIAYRASVVLIEPPVVPRSPLPVRERRLHLLQLRRPEIDAVVAGAPANVPPVPEAPILVGRQLVVRGRRLRGDLTRVRVGGVLIEPEPEDVTDHEVRVTVAEPPFAATTLRAGVMGAQVVHLLAPDRPAVESNVAAFVLRPTVTSATHGAVGPVTDPEPGVELVVRPPVRKDQAATLLLSELPGNDGAGYSFPALRRTDDVSPLQVPVEGVPTGTYLVRVQVDGAESPIVEGAAGQLGPTVAIP